MSPKEKLQQLLSYAGIQINGTRDYDIQVHDERVYSEVLSRGSLALGETYMYGGWDVKHPDQFFTKVLRRGLAKEIGSWRSIFPWLRAKLINLQGRSRAFEVGEKHYDIGNKLYSLMLDERMIYSCAYWKDAETFEGLPIEIRVQDYRDLNEEFDAIISTGMFEHVGVKNYRAFMEVVSRCLVEDGLF